MTFDMEVGLGPSYIVLDGDPAPLPQKGTQPPCSAHFYSARNARIASAVLATAIPSVRLSSPLPSNRHHQSSGDCLEGKGKIIRSVLCNIVCNNCAQYYAHTHEQT